MADEYVRLTSGIRNRKAFSRYATHIMKQDPEAIVELAKKTLIAWVKASDVPRTLEIIEFDQQRWVNINMEGN